MPKRFREHRAWLLEQLTDPDVAADYLNEARKESRAIFLKALRSVAESRRIAVVAEETGLNRESLYKSLSEDGNPRLETYDSVLSALGLDYSIIPKNNLIPKTPRPPTGRSICIGYTTTSGTPLKTNAGTVSTHTGGIFQPRETENDSFYLPAHEAMKQGQVPAPVPSPLNKQLALVA